jgi:hypothetical protein
MACTTNNVCLDVCLKITITPGSGIDAVEDTHLNKHYS